MTVSAVTSGTLAVGQTITGTGIGSNIEIKSFVTGKGGVGTYTIGAKSTDVYPPACTGSACTVTCKNGASNPTMCDTFPNITASSMCPNGSTPSAVLVGSINNTTLNVTNITSGRLSVGQNILGNGITQGTSITGYLTGTSLTGTYAVTPSQASTETTAIACATGTSGTTSASCTTTSLNYPACLSTTPSSSTSGPKVDFYAVLSTKATTTKPTIDYGSTLNLAWNVKNVRYCAFSSNGPISELTGLPATIYSSGSVTSSKLYTSQTLRLSCTDGTITTSNDVVVKVGARPTPGDVTITWTSGNDKYVNNVLDHKQINTATYAPVTLSWQTTNAVNCSLYRDGALVKDKANLLPNANTTIFENNNGNFLYTLSCNNPDGVATTSTIPVKVSAVGCTIDASTVPDTNPYAPNTSATVNGNISEDKNGNARCTYTYGDPTSAPGSSWAFKGIWGFPSDVPYDNNALNSSTIPDTKQYLCPYTYYTSTPADSSTGAGSQTGAWLDRTHHPSWSYINATFERKYVSCGAQFSVSFWSGANQNNMSDFIMQNDGGSGVCNQWFNAVSSLTCQVNNASFTPPVVTIAASPSTVAIGGSATLSWSSSDNSGNSSAISCTVTGGGLSSTASNNSGLTTGPLTTDTTYSITCTNAAGSTTKTTTVGAVTKPVITLTATPTIVGTVTGKVSNLKWTSTNATSCSRTGGLSPWPATSSTLNNTTGIAVSPTTATTYSITCVNSSGSTPVSTTASTLVSVWPAPVVSISDSISRFGIATINWSYSNATSCTLNGTGWSGTNPAVLSTSTTSGSYPNAPRGKTYGFSCTGPSGTATTPLISL